MVSDVINLHHYIQDLPQEIQLVTGWGKHSTVFGHSPVKERVKALLDSLDSPFAVPEHNIGCLVADRGKAVQVEHIRLTLS